MINNYNSFLDVRMPFEFEEGHYPGAVNIPLNEIPARLDEVKALQPPVLVYCRSGNRSGQAVAWLRANGISDVTNGGGLHELL